MTVTLSTFVERGRRRRLGLVVAAEELAPAVLALPRAARQLLRQLGGGQRLERLVHVLDRRVRIEPLDPLLQLPGRLRAAEHEHGEQRDLRGNPAERVVEQVAVLGDPAAGAAREPHPAAAREAVERPADLGVVVVDDRIAIRGLVAGEPERVQRERVLVGRRPLLLDQAAEDADLNGVGVHAANRSAGRGVS